VTIDISNLSQEKRAFLKATGFLESLEHAIPQQVARIKKKKEKKRKGKSKLQRELALMDKKTAEIRSKAHDLRHLMEIEWEWRKQHEVSKEAGALVCPVCGEGNKGNMMNGKPWCLKCNCPLVPKGKVEKWKRMAHIKQATQRLGDEMKKLGYDF